MAPVSEALKVDLFFDATLSMRGFVSTEASSTYQQTVPLLERGVIEGWQGGKATFYKFGDDIAELPGRAYLDAVRPTFYGDSKYNRKTLIERVVDRAQPDHLTVIVTDLFQDNADVNQLSERLKQKFIVNGLAIGVYAVRSQFAGVVYDVGADNYSFPYKAEKAESGRPFYLLAFGRHSDIDHYFNVLGSRGLNFLPETHALILSRHLTSAPASFISGARLKAADKISEISGSNLLSGSYRGERVKAFKISKGKAAAKFSTELAYAAPLKNVLSYGDALIPEVTAWKGEDRGGKELVLAESPEALKAIRVAAKLLPEQAPFDKLELAADFDVRELPVGVYGYRILLRPRTYERPAWVAGWNMRDDDIKGWRTRPQDFDGTKTYNLENFLGTLQGAVLTTAPPKVCDVYLYVRVDK